MSALAELAARYELPAGAVARLERLLDALASSSAPTTVHDRAEATRVHVADSLSGLVSSELRAARRMADLGAGAGLPGLVVAVALPAASVTLVESVGRKCDFLRAAAASMGLENVDVVCERAERWEAGRGVCDVVTARAVAPLSVLCEYAAPLLREGGALVAWKGEVGPDEAADARAAAAQLGLAEPVVLAVTPYPGSHSRHLHVLRKVAPTPPGFPRRPGMAAKRPVGRSRRSPR